ncbi:AAA family ATPase [Nonomuraea roseola]|uniref:AAA family ATPase n=1 Tax=Nonomuraea roseola TaxID=46179 RepID=A0ABV5QBD3_9ACTN
MNGTFGAGKTTTSDHLMALLANAHLFDPETVGYCLRHVINEEINDFQNWPAWRALAAETINQLARHRGVPLVVPMTLLRQQYHQEILFAPAGHGLPVRHILLHANEDALVQRIERDSVGVAARQWRLNHLEVYRDALPWLRESAEVFDTTHISAAEVAVMIAEDA